MRLDPRSKSEFFEIEIYDDRTSIYEDDIENVGGNTFSIDDMGGFSEDINEGYF